MKIHWWQNNMKYTLCKRKKPNDILIAWFKSDVTCKQCLAKLTSS